MYKSARRHNPADDNHRPPSQWRTEGVLECSNPPTEIPKTLQNRTKLNTICENC